MKTSPSAALVIIDAQVDFCPGGALAVPRGDEIIPLLNRLARNFATVVLTQDWHPAGHHSFAASHQNHEPFQTKELFYGTQVLWPDHCVAGTPGAAFHPDLDIESARLILRKGCNIGIDSYSAFLEADRSTKTGLDGYFTSRGITDLYFCGLAEDFCVAWSAEDARAFGFNATLIDDACRAIDLSGSLAASRTRLTAVGVTRTSSGAVQDLKQHGLKSNRAAID